MFRLPFYIDWEQTFYFWSQFFALVFGLSWYVGCCCSSSMSSFEPCNTCTPGTVPEDWQVEFTGVVDDNCDDCDSVNNITFILNEAHVSGVCNYHHVSTMTNCSSDPPSNLQCIVLTVNSLATGIDVSVGILFQGGVCGSTFWDGVSDTFGAGAGNDIDCTVPYSNIDMNNSGLLLSPRCDWSLATMDATPIAAD